MTAITASAENDSLFGEPGHGGKEDIRRYQEGRASVVGARDVARVCGTYKNIHRREIREFNLAND